MAFFTSAVGALQTLVIALGAGLGIWGVINLLEGYGNDNAGAKSQGMKHVIPNYVESKSRITKQNMLCISHTGATIFTIDKEQQTLSFCCSLCFKLSTPNPQ